MSVYPICVECEEPCDGWCDCGRGPGGFPADMPTECIPDDASVPTPKEDSQ